MKKQANQAKQSKQKRPKRAGFFDDSTPKEIQLFLRSIGEFEIKHQTQPKIEKAVLRRSNSMQNLRQKEYFRDDCLLPKSMRRSMKRVAKDVSFF